MDIWLRPPVSGWDPHHEFPPIKAKVRTMRFESQRDSIMQPRVADEIGYPGKVPKQTPTLKGLNPGRQTAQSLAKILLQLVFSRRNAGRFSRIPCYATKPIATSEEFWRMRGINPVRVVRSLGWGFPR